MANLTNVLSKTPTLNKPEEFSFDAVNTTQQEAPIEAPATAPSVNTVDTNQVEALQKAPVLPKETPVTERFVPDVPPEDTEVTNLKGENDKLREDIKSGLEGLATEGEFTAQAEQDAGIVAKREAKTRIDNKIRQQQRDTDLAIRDIEDSFGTRAQKTARKNELINKSNRQLADLSIIQMARGGELADAQATVDRKVELEMQGRRAKIDALMFMYTENKERFTLAEQREFDKKIKQEERDYQKEYDKTKQLEDMKLQMVLNATELGAGDAVLQQIQRATDIEGLLSLPNSQQYMKSQAQRDDERMRRIELLKAQRAPTSVVDRGNGMKQLINTQTGAVIATYGQGELEGVAPFEKGSVEEARATEDVNNIAQLATHPGLNSSVGPVGMARIGLADAFGAKDEFIGNVENMLSSLTLSSFEEAKARGATFGAMDKSEWDILAQSATKISKWREYKGTGTDREVVGYDVNEKAFKKELDSLTQYAKLGFINKGGDPASVGVAQLEDGSFATKNSDGSYTVIR